MTHIAAQVGPEVTTGAPVPRITLWARLRRHLDALHAAHARQLQFTPALDAIARDSALPVEDVLGVTAYDPALPFFMQAGFDRAD